jgi:glycosyltransferase involved in cell wall biosynthesis
MTGRIVTFSSLFPSAAFPTHGLFVQDRMQRVAEASGLEWCAVAPVPLVPAPLRTGERARRAAMPLRETVAGVRVEHPRYFHLPGLSTARQAARIARASLDIVRELTRGQPAVLDAHYVYPDGVAALRIAAQLRLPCIVTARGTDLNVLAGKPAIARQVRAAAGEAFALLAVSEALRRRFVAITGLPDASVRLSRNGVDLERFRPGDRAAARAALGLPAHGPLLLGVGRLVASKGFHRAVDLLRELPDARLVLVGEGPQRQRLARLAPRQRLLLLGSLPPPAVALAYQACDLLVLPSEREGWPNVVTEALASGLPVVASAVGGIPEILSDPACGIAVPPGDAAALARAARHFLDAPPSRAAVRAFAARYSWAQPVSELVELVQRALGAAARRTP